MRLTQWTDYALRVLMYCAACQQRTEPVTISEIADNYQISRSHLTKIVFELGMLKLLETSRGRGGGIRLSKPAEQIRLGDVVRTTETDFDMVECFNPSQNQCRLSLHCRLKGVLQEATQQYLATLDAVTLADLVNPAQAKRVAKLAARQQPTPGLPLTRDVSISTESSA